MQLSIACTHIFNMKKTPFLALLVTLVTSIAFAGCDSSTETDYEVSSDCLVSAVTLGTLNRTMHTTSSTGADSTYTVSVTGSLYPVYIDQINNHIYNADSLPVGTDVTKVVFSTFTASGRGTMKNMTTGADSTFTASDSTDFSRPRVLTVYSADARWSREYTVDIRVHREEADTFAWQKIAGDPTNAVANLTESRALSVERTLYVFGTTGDGQVKLVQTTNEDPDFGTAKDVTTDTGGAIDVRSVQLFKGTFYAVAGNRLVKAATDDATHWTTVNGAPAFGTLTGVSSDSIYAMDGGGMYASVDGAIWAMSTVDTENALPVSGITSAVLPSRTDDTFESVVMVGLKDGKANVWKRDIDRKGDYNYPWMYLPQTEELGDYACPVLNHTALIAYDEAVVLTGIATGNEVSPFYVSRDYGRTWKPGDMKHPLMQHATSLAVTVDTSHYVWIFCGGTGEVYKGRINRLGWQNEPTRFDRK